jgi:hypothetical protein
VYYSIKVVEAPNKNSMFVSYLMAPQVELEPTTFTFEAAAYFSLTFKISLLLLTCQTPFLLPPAAVVYRAVEQPPPRVRLLVKYILV